MNNKFYYLLVSLFQCVTISLSAQDPVIELEEFSTGYTSPVDIKNCGDSRLFIVQQNGYIYISDSSGVINTTPFLDIHTIISQSSERGLLGVVFHPAYFDNGFFFVYYTGLADGSITIARYNVSNTDENLADPNSELILMQIPHPVYNNHNGGCLQFGPDGYLYIGTGDGGSGGDPDENSQNTKKYLGKLLRLDVDNGSPYTVPADNPFVADTANYYPEIWAYGLRNPWRYSFDLITGDLWIGDVGQSNWEEIDYMAVDGGGGQNYGWDCYEGTHTFEPGNCSVSDVITYPVYEYAHSSGSNGDCSLTGGYIYRGAQYANLYGKYISVDYCSGKFRATLQNADGTFTTSVVGDEVISQDEFSFSTFGEDYLGELYVADVTHGKIYRVKDTACSPVAKILSNLNGVLALDTAVCIGTELKAVTGKDFTYQWQFNGADVSGATSPIYNAGVAGTYTLIAKNADNCSNISTPVVAGSPTQPSIEGIDTLYCSTQSPDTLYGIPPGGIFTGEGIIGNTFNPSVAGIGTHTIVYTYENEYSCIAIQSANIIVETCTGINDPASNNEINIYPNPGSGIFTITNIDPTIGVTELSIFNLSGKQIKTLDYNPTPTGILKIDIHSLADGMYLLKITKASSVIYKKLMIENK